MRKRLLLPTLALCTALSACGGSQNTQETTSTEISQVVTTVSVETTTGTVEETTMQSNISLNEIEGWLIGDIWNEGFCDFYHYEEDGKSSLGETIDIDFALSRFKKNYEKKAEYDAYINSLPDSYDSIKETWNKLSVEMDKLYDYYKDGVTQSGTATDTALFVQYRDAFSEDIKSVEDFDSKPNANSSSQEIVSDSSSALSDLEQYLLNQGVLSGNRTDVFAQMIGAKSGIKYKDSGVEIYEYSPDAKEYKELVKGNPVTIEGFEEVEITAKAINGNFVLIETQDKTASQDLINAFESYNK